MGDLKIFLVCSVFAAASAIASGQVCSGALLGKLLNINHNVSGMMYIEDDTTYCISDFYYDGAGPDAFLYLYYPGESTSIKGGGVYARVPGQDRIQFEEGREYLGETFQFEVPEGHRTCDYAAFGIWCRYASQLFTLITYDIKTIFSTDGADNTIACTASPGRGYVGELPATSNGVSGDFFIASNKTFGIRDFNYDGLGTDAFVYVVPVGITADASSQMDGTIIDNGFLANTSYDNATLNIIIPDDVDLFTCDVGTFTILDTGGSTFYTQLSIDVASFFTNNPAFADHNRVFVHCDRPTTRPGVLVGELTREYNGLEGTFYVQDQDTFYIQLFSFDGKAPTAFLYYYRRGRMVKYEGHGYKINFNSTQTSLPTGVFYKKHTPFIVDLNLAAEETDVRACDIEWFTVWCEEYKFFMTRIQIPENIFTTDPDHPGIATKNRVFCTQTEEVPTGAGASPTASLLSAFTVCLIALAALFVRA